MALVPCAQRRQPFYASCHDASCIGAVCPYCEYAEILPEETYGDDASPTGCVRTQNQGWSRARRSGILLLL